MAKVNIPKDDAKSFGRRLKACRITRYGKTDADIDRCICEIGLDRKIWIRMEQGLEPVTLSDLARFLEVFSPNVFWLLLGPDDDFMPHEDEDDTEPEVDFIVTGQKTPPILTDSKANLTEDDFAYYQKEKRLCYQLVHTTTIEFYRSLDEAQRERIRDRVAEEHPIIPGVGPEDKYTIKFSEITNSPYSSDEKMTLTYYSGEVIDGTQIGGTGEEMRMVPTSYEMFCHELDEAARRMALDCTREFCEESVITLSLLHITDSDMKYIQLGVYMESVSKKI